MEGFVPPWAIAVRAEPNYRLSSERLSRCIKSDTLPCGWSVRYSSPEHDFMSRTLARDVLEDDIGDTRLHHGRGQRIRRQRPGLRTAAPRPRNCPAAT